METAIERFWKIEDPSAFDHVTKAVSIEDAAVLQPWQSSVGHSDGYYVLPIPFKSKPPTLPDSLKIAKKRLYLLSKRFDKDEVLASQYNTTLEDLFATGHAEEVIGTSSHFDKHSMGA